MTKTHAEASEGPAEETPASRMPVPKMAAAGIGGAVATVLVWILLAVGVEVPPEVAVAISAIVAFAAGYIKGA